MSFSDLPTELIFPIADNLFKHDLSRFIRSSKRLAILLTPQLYNKAFNPNQVHDECTESDENSDDEFDYFEPREEGKIRSHIAANRLWESGKHWTSERLLDYFSRMPIDWVPRIEFHSDGITTAEYYGTTLELVVRAGNPRLVKLLLDRGLDVDLLGADKMTPLGVAAECGELETAKLLLEEGASVLAQDNKMRTPLLLAIWEEHFDIASLLLYADEQGKTVNLVGRHGCGPLHFAAEKDNSIPLVERLLAKGANLFGGDPDYVMTALDHAIRYRQDELAFVLLDKMLAQPHELARLGPSWGDGNPLHIAISEAFWPMVHRLVKEGLPIEGSMEVAIREGAEPIFDLLAEVGPAVWPTSLLAEPLRMTCGDKNLKGLQMICSLIKQGKLKADRSLIDSQFPVNRLLDYHHRGVKEQVPEMLRLLLDIGASAETYRDGTPLQIMLQSYKGQTEGPEFEVIKLLIGATTDFSITKAFTKDNLIHQIALQKVKPTSPAGEIEIMDLLLSKGVDINALNRKRNTPLHLVASRTHPEKEKLVAFLLSKGANPNLKNFHKESPLRILVSFPGNLQSIILLADAGADIHVMNGKSQPLTHIAASRNLDEYVKYFVQRGVNRHSRCHICTKKLDQMAKDGEID
jgi:ankyrin repeat protein